MYKTYLIEHKPTKQELKQAEKLTIALIKYETMFDRPKRKIKSAIAMYSENMKHSYYVNVFVEFE